MKPQPNYIRFGLGTGWIAIRGDSLVLWEDEAYEGGQEIEMKSGEDCEKLASVLPVLAKHLLHMLDPDISKEILFENDLSEVALLEKKEPAC
jgi:hypothetical protein